MYAGERWDQKGLLSGAGNGKSRAYEAKAACFRGQKEEGLQKGTTTRKGGWRGYRALGWESCWGDPGALGAGVIRDKYKGTGGGI